MLATNRYVHLPCRPEILQKKVKPLIIPDVSIHLPFEIIDLDENCSVNESAFSQPFRSNFFQIVFITQGITICRADFDQHEIHANNLGFVRPGQITQITPSAGVSGYILRFTAGYLNAAVEKSFLISQSTLVGFASLPFLNINDSDKEDLTSIVEKIASEYKSITTYKSPAFCMEIISGLLKVFLIYLSKISLEQLDSRQNNKIEVVEKFFSLLEENFKVFKTPAEYASSLKISPGYLNEVLKRASGYTTSHFIHQRILIEAKRMTVYSDTSMKEVAYALGYEDMSHFSKFFKKTSGECYSDYKKNLKGDTH